MERLYQPDFSCIFGEKYGNAFSYNKIDSLIWPIFSDIEYSNPLKNLLKIKDNSGYSLFYTRKISIEDEKIELNCSDIHLGFIQAMNTGKPYGISNSDVVEVVKRDSTIFKGILSFDLSEKSKEQNIVNKIGEIQEQIPVCGVALYPSLTKLDLNNPNNKQLDNMMKYCRNKSLFVKLDLCNLNLPESHPECITLEKIESFVSSYSRNTIILSGFSYGQMEYLTDRLKRNINLWLEIDPRNIGGMTPTETFTKIFKIQGFIQNFWYRISIGSATPTLEMSQMVRGFIKATDQLKFTQKNLLRTWTFRNINRLNSAIFKPIYNLNSNIFLNVEENSDKSYKNQVISTHIIKLRSYSITQLLFLTDIIKNIFDKTIKKYPEVSDGEILLRSYHTTTTLIINEHEIGNYLDLHYYFAELSAEESSDFIHTVFAKENRPDFNHPDHRIASTYGSKQLIIPIRDRKLEFGSRENFYLLATFGPRTLEVFIQMKFFKEN
jgi:thiamine phosphate synthase YjbQ (UPF0047 family)